MKVSAFRIVEPKYAMRVVPGSNRRDWMDETPHKYAYRCLPLQIANCTGWDVYPPCDFVVNWSGGQHMSDLQINYEDSHHHFAHSSFGCGILTMHSGYLFKTEPGWDMLATGPINEPIDWGYPLTGVVETFWLDFTFTFNIKLFKPGWFKISKDKPVARIMPYPHKIDIETSVVDILSDAEQAEKYKEWEKDRVQKIREVQGAFNQGQNMGEVIINEPKTHWEKNYYIGQDKSGVKIQDHITKRKYPEFK